MNDAGSRPSRFALSKWYLDLVTGDGRVFIGYWGEITWRGAALRIESKLEAPPEGPSMSRSAWTRGRGPQAERDGSLRWSSRRLGFDACWKPTAPPVSRRLFERASGHVDWDCRAPLAEASVRSSGGATIAGLGYAERLTMTLPPWRLPLDELRWGRFVAPRLSVVWIEWCGPSPLRLVFVNGAEAPRAVIRDGGVDLTPGALLRLGRTRALRSGQPFHALAAELSGLASVLPARLRAIEEEKWLSAGTLVAGDTSVEGWAIHERVRFGKEKR